MKCNLTKVSLALVSAVFILGCQDLGSGPVGPDGPQFNKPGLIEQGDCEDMGKVFNNGHCHAGDVEDPVVDPGMLFESAAFTCDGGAATINTSVGTVNFNQPRGHSHMHANVQLRGAPEGVYDIFGNHDLVCVVDPNDDTNKWVDFFLRGAHHTSVTVGANGKGKARIGLDFGGPDGLLAPASHEAGPHRLWVTLVAISGPAAGNGGTVLRSTAVEVVIPVHDDH